MKGLVGFLITCSCLAGLACADEAVTPPPSRLTRNVPNVLLLGPKDSLTTAKRISGKTRLIPAFPSSVKAAEVEFYVDAKSVGKASAKPFRFDLDTASLTAGEHLIKAVARDSAGTEIWAATSKANTQPLDAATAEPALDPVPEQEQPSVENPGSKPTENTGAGPAESAPLGQSLDKAYISRNYGISVKYPSAWAVRDDTQAVAQSQPCMFWVVFGAEPLTVNVHAQKLNPGTDAVTFARYNSYVQSWNTKKVWNRPAFATTTGSPEDKSVVHRLIVIDNGRALMINCIDKTGRPIAESISLFERIVGSMKPSAK